MTTYQIINKEARVFTRPTGQIKTEDLEKLMLESRDDLPPPTVRYPQMRGQ